VISKRKDWNIGTRWWVCLDALVGLLAVLGAYALSPQLEVGWSSGILGQPGAWPAALLFSPLLVVCCQLVGLQDPMQEKKAWIVLWKTVVAVSVAVLLLLVALYAWRLWYLGRIALSFTLLLSSCGILAGRAVIFALAHASPKRMALMLDLPREQLAEKIIQKSALPFVVVWKQSEEGQQCSGLTPEKGEGLELDELVVDGAEHPEANWYPYINRGIQVTDYHAFFERYAKRVAVEHIDASWLLHVDFKMTHPFYHRLKRMLDVIVAGVGLVLVFPLLLLSMALVALETGFPVFYIQDRTGFLEKTFRLVKLRTYRKEHNDQGSPYTQDKDHRVTMSGAWLRKTRMDELPQLFNVLRGEMSIVGPRPEWTKLAGEYEAKIPYYAARHLVKPGITGWAQINYPYGASVEDAVEKLKLDLFYVKHASLLLDFQIILRTISTLMKGSK